MYFIGFFFLLFYIGSVNKDVTEQENKLSKSVSNYLHRNFDDFFLEGMVGSFVHYARYPREFAQNENNLISGNFFQHTHYHVVGERGCENTSKNLSNYNVRDL